MISTKIDKQTAQEYAAPTPDDGPRYFYGTSICLDNDLLQKLGFSSLPEVGGKFTLSATVEVTGVRSNERQGSTESSVDLQITEMELGLKPVSNDERAKKLYPGQA